MNKLSGAIHKIAENLLKLKNKGEWNFVGKQTTAGLFNSKLLIDNKFKNLNQPLRKESRYETDDFLSLLASSEKKAGYILSANEFSELLKKIKLSEREKIGSAILFDRINDFVFYKRNEYVGNLRKRSEGIRKHSEEGAVEPALLEYKKRQPWIPEPEKGEAFENVVSKRVDQELQEVDQYEKKMAEVQREAQLEVEKIDEKLSELQEQKKKKLKPYETKQIKISETLNTLREELKRVALSDVPMGSIQRWKEFLIAHVNKPLKVEASKEELIAKLIEQFGAKMKDSILLAEQAIIENKATVQEVIVKYPATKPMLTSSITITSGLWDTIVTTVKDAIAKLQSAFSFFSTADSEIDNIESQMTEVTASLNKQSNTTELFQEWIDKAGLNYKVIDSKFDHSSFGGTDVYNLIIDINGDHVDGFGVLTGYAPTEALDIPELKITITSNGDVVKINQKINASLNKKSDEDEEHKYTNYYKCSECGEKWQNTDVAKMDDRCPHCGAEIVPYKSEDIEKKKASLNKKSDEHEEVETISDEPIEPEPGDYILSDSGPLGSKTSVSILDEKFLGKFNSTDEALSAIKANMEQNKFFPNVWQESDHGNLELVTHWLDETLKGASFKQAVLTQKVNPKTNQEEYALVSSSDPSKVLKYFGPSKPSDEAVAKEEKRVQYFKHQGSQDFSGNHKHLSKNDKSYTGQVHTASVDAWFAQFGDHLQKLIQRDLELAKEWVRRNWENIKGYGEEWTSKMKDYLAMIHPPEVSDALLEVTAEKKVEAGVLDDLKNWFLEQVESVKPDVDAMTQSAQEFLQKVKDAIVGVGKYDQDQVNEYVKNWGDWAAQQIGVPKLVVGEKGYPNDTNKCRYCVWFNTDTTLDGHSGFFGRCSSCLRAYTEEEFKKFNKEDQAEIKDYFQDRGATPVNVTTYDQKKASLNKQARNTREIKNYIKRNYSDFISKNNNENKFLEFLKGIFITNTRDEIMDAFMEFKNEQFRENELNKQADQNKIDAFQDVDDNYNTSYVIYKDGKYVETLKSQTEVYNKYGDNVRYLQGETPIPLKYRNAKLNKQTVKLYNENPKGKFSFTLELTPSDDWNEIRTKLQRSTRDLFVENEQATQGYLNFYVYADSLDEARVMFMPVLDSLNKGANLKIWNKQADKEELEKEIIDVEKEHKPTIEKIRKDISKDDKLNMTDEEIELSIGKDHIDELGEKYYDKEKGIKNFEKELKKENHISNKDINYKQDQYRYSKFVPRKGDKIKFRGWAWIVEDVKQDRFGEIFDLYMPGDPDVTEKDVTLLELEKGNVEFIARDDEDINYKQAEDEEPKDTFDTWFDRFLEEKDLPYQSWDIEGSDGMTHIIDSDVVIEHIKAFPNNIKKKIKDKIVQIDFANGNVMDFFKYIAEGIVNPPDLNKQADGGTVQPLYTTRCPRCDSEITLTPSDKALSNNVYCKKCKRTFEPREYKSKSEVNLVFPDMRFISDKDKSKKKEKSQNG